MRVAIFSVWLVAGLLFVLPPADRGCSVSPGATVDSPQWRSDLAECLDLDRRVPTNNP